MRATVGTIDGRNQDFEISRWAWDAGVPFLVLNLESGGRVMFRTETVSWFKVEGTGKQKDVEDRVPKKKAKILPDLVYAPDTPHAGQPVKYCKDEDGLIGEPLFIWNYLDDGPSGNTMRLTEAIQNGRVIPA